MKMIVPKTFSYFFVWFALFQIIAFYNKSFATGENILTKELFTTPEKWDESSLSFSNDCQQYAFVVKADEGEFVVNNGKNDKTFPDVGSIAIAPKSAKLFYWVKDKVDRISLMADGRLIPTEYVSEGWLRFSKDGQRWVTIGGTKETQKGNIIERGQVIIIADGKEIGHYQDACIPSFSLDGKHLAYLAKDDTNNISLYVDGKKEMSYSKPEVECSFVLNAYIIGPNMNNLFSCKYLSDDKLLILTQDKNGWIVYKDKEVLGTYLQNVWGGGQLRTYYFSEFKTTESIVAWSLIVAEESPIAIWWERIPGEEEKWRVVKDGKPVDSIVCTHWWERPVVSSNGLHCGYIAVTKASSPERTEVHAIIDGKKYGPYGNVWGITFTNDGKHFTFAATEPNENKSWSVFLDGKPLSSKYESFWSPILSSDGIHVAWRAERESKVAIGIDGNEVTLENKVLRGPRFEGTERVSWITIENNRILSRSVPISSYKK